MIIAYIDAGTIAAFGAALAGGLAGLKAFLTASYFSKRKKGGAEETEAVNETKIRETVEV